MPRNAWTPKRERQYEHIKDSLLDRGRSEGKAEEIAARTVNKVRAQEGEAHKPSQASLKDLAPSRRGGLRSHRGAAGRTFKQLYEQARAKNIAGRSTMNKAQLEKAVGS